MKWLTKRLEKYNVGTGATRTSTLAEITKDEDRALMREKKGTLSLTDCGAVSYKLLDGCRIASPEATEKLFNQMEAVGRFEVDADEVVKLNKVSIRYGDRTILKELDWTVHRGEKWALSGENGAGKSTLLSLVCADNPQSYACDISLFGRKRGTGESIWEIKKHIGYVSPEMHRAYLKTCRLLRL